MWLVGIYDGQVNAKDLSSLVLSPSNAKAISGMSAGGFVLCT